MDDSGRTVAAKGRLLGGTGTITHCNDKELAPRRSASAERFSHPANHSTLRRDTSAAGKGCGWANVNVNECSVLHLPELKGFLE